MHRAQYTLKGALIVQVNSFNLIEQRSPDSETKYHTRNELLWG